MNRKNLAILAFSAVFALSYPGGKALAETYYESKRGGDAAFPVKDFSKPGILQTSPLYFFKELRRGLQGILTVGNAKKMELELLNLQELGAELQKLMKVAPQKTDAIRKTIENYNDNLSRLAEKVNAGIYQNKDKNLGRLTDEIVVQNSKHILLFKKLYSDYPDLRPAIDESFLLLSQTLESAMPGTEKNLRELRWEKLISGEANDVNGLLNGIRSSATAVDYLQREARSAAAAVKENLILKLEGMIKAGRLPLAELGEIFKTYDADAVSKLELIDAIREGLTENDIRTELNIVRGAILETNSILETFKKETRKMAPDLLDTAEKLINLIEPADQRPSKARLILEQARTSYDLKDYPSALSQAIGAAASVRRELYEPEELSKKEKESALAGLRMRYDSLFQPESELLPSFEEAEKMIVKLNAEKTVSRESVNRVKTLLYAIEAKLHE